MLLKNKEIQMRSDEYALGCFAKNGNGQLFFCGENKELKLDELSVKVSTVTEENLFTVETILAPNRDFSAERISLNLGVDCYMEKYPDWDFKMFPTALRCEKNGFWGCFCSPAGVMLGMCSPDNIVSWCNHYNLQHGDVGHRVFSSAVDFLNVLEQPARHIKSPKILKKDTTYSYKLFFKVVENQEELYDFVKEYADITVPKFLKLTLEEVENPVLLSDESCEFKKLSEQKPSESRVAISDCTHAEARLFVRHDWMYYLKQACKSAEKCQQKPGTNCESWYGYFSRILYAKYDKNYDVKSLEKEFIDFLKVITKFGDLKHFKNATYPKRLQNTSTTISILADFYEVTGKVKYLDIANDMAKSLLKYQVADGSYRSHKTHYTCVIYPAKSMLELALAEKKANLIDRYNVHFDSAKRAIYNLYELMDNIETEGEMTFEDGMISCEALQLGYYATLCGDENERKNFAKASEKILEKHRCLEQWLVPDARTKGATMRYWEARYDINFPSNMLNTPHAWTSWKTYATYYLYLLTGQQKYLIDTMDTIGACMQCVDDNGELNWAFILDPCIHGKKFVKSNNELGFEFQETVVGEEYLPMIYDWYRQNPKKIYLQYIGNMNNPKTWKKAICGSCDNDVHEHFKCLEETVFGKAFVHLEESKTPLHYNCYVEKNGYSSKDEYVKTYIVRSDKSGEIIIDNTTYPYSKGVNFIGIL